MVFVCLRRARALPHIEKYLQLMALPHDDDGTVARMASSERRKMLDQDLLDEKARSELEQKMPGSKSQAFSRRVRAKR